MLLEKLIWIVATRTVFYIDEGNLVCVDYCFSFFHYGGTFKLIDMHEPNMVEVHDEYCPCDECCYEESLQVDQEEAELLQSNRDFWLECMQDPDLPY